VVTILETRRQNSSLQPRVGLEMAMETLSLPVVRRLIAEEQHQEEGRAQQRVSLEEPWLPLYLSIDYRGS